MEDNPNRYTVEQEKSTDAEGETDIYNITWTIPMFGHLLETKAMEGFRSPRYTVIEVPDTPFQLKVAFFGLHADLMEVYYLTTTSSIVKLSLKIRYEHNFNRDISVDNQAVQANEWQRSAALNYLGSIDRNRYSRPLLMYFKCTVSQARKVVCRNIPLVHTPQLSEDFETLLTNTGYSDVTMKSVEGKEFRALKAVLAVRSNFLRAHFLHNSIESVEIFVMETPWETEVLKDVLTFMYTDKAPRVDDAPDKLLVAADYYELLGLKSLCEEALCKTLTVENAVETLQLAELHSANTLKQSTLAFIKNGRAKLVTKTEGWANIQSVEFIKRIYDFIVADDSTDILAAALNEIGLK
ncbi:Roadkill [Operophtera brumata]|uniref:Roadkill n=1 Tax=Operophtera brumata TaxID=104452 RepID=A0A0L7K445_OPEBR|nr:Roadkill [Operophtera brumata]